MRKIGSEKTADEKRKRNTLVLSIFILVILVGGTVGYAFISNPSSGISSGDSTGNANGYLLGNRWVMIVDGIEMSFAHPPESVLDVPVEATISTTTYKGLSLYIDSDNNAINSEIASVLGYYVSRIQRACYGPCEEDFPEKDCSENIIIWEDSPENKVYHEDNCVFIEGDLRAVDAFLYRTLGINK